MHIQASEQPKTEAAGIIVIAPRVVFTLAFNAALSTYGVVGIASRYTGADCTHHEPRRGLEIAIHDGDDSPKRVTVSIHIIAEYGVRIQAVTSSLQHQIKYSHRAQHRLHRGSCERACVGAARDK